MNPRSKLFAVLAVAVLYVAAAKVGGAVASTAGQLPLVWPPTGLSLAVLLLLDMRAWPGVFLGAFVATLGTDDGLVVASCIATGNTLEAVTAAWAIHRFIGPGEAINWLRCAIGLVVFGALAATLVSATVGVLSLCSSGLRPWTSFRPLWWTWWLGDVAGTLLVAPVLLTWRARPRLKTTAAAVEAAVLTACLVVASLAVFSRRFATAAPYPLEYAVFPLIIWAALRFGVAGASAASALTAGIAMWGTSVGLGPYAAGQGDERLMMLQVFVSTVAGSGFVLGAAISERDTARARKAGTLEAAVDCIITIDHVGRILEFNPAAERTFGYRSADILGRELAELIITDPLRDQPREARARHGHAGASGDLARRLETVARRADGTDFPVELSITRIPSEGPPVFTAFLRDITEQERIVKGLTFRAAHDSLTNLLNSAAFMERLTAAASQANTGNRGDIAVLFVDLDGFKQINDRFGHLFGDRLLVAVARRLRAAVRPGDAVARMGGDEFAILLEQVHDAAEVSALALRIHKALDRPFTIDGRQVRAEASVGTALGSPSGPKAEDLLHAADVAMYRAKASQPGRRR